MWQDGFTGFPCWRNAENNTFIRQNNCKFITDMFRTSRVFIAVFGAGFALLAALLFVGCSGDSSPDGFGAPEFLSVSAKADGNSVYLTCSYKGRGAGICGFALAKGGAVVKRMEAETRSEGSFSLNVKDLEYDTEYVYYAWISNGSAEIHSNTGTVHTEQKPEPEQVFVSVTAKAEGNSVHLACTYEGLETDSFGFVLTKHKKEVKRQEAEMTKEGSFSLTFEDLEYDTDYGYYAWIVKGKEEIRSNTGTVHTEPKPVIAPAILSLSADADENVLTLRCTYEGEGVDGGGFYFNGSARLGADIIQDGNMSLTIGNLEYNQEYEFIAYITSGQTEIKSEPAKAHTGKMSSIPIPDAAFKAYVLSLYDSDKNAKLSMEEAEKITRLDINTYDLQIKTLEGIEYFTNLEYLKAVGYDDSRRGEVSSLDLSKNVKLETLICPFNRLESFDLQNCTRLKYLNCSSNMLDNIANMFSFSDNTALEYLDCHSNDSFTVFLRNNTALKYIDCNHTMGQEYFGGCSSLEYLDCSYCQVVVSLNIAGLKKLTTLKCEGNGSLQYFDASGCENLVFDQRLLDSFAGLYFVSFNVRGCKKLTSFDFSNKGVAMNNIDLRDCINLKTVKCNGCVVDILDVRGCTALTELECYENFLHELDVSSCKKLNLRAWPQSTNFDKLWIGSGEYHFYDSSGAEVNPADYGTEVTVRE